MVRTRIAAGVFIGSAFVFAAAGCDSKDGGGASSAAAGGSTKPPTASSGASAPAAPAPPAKLTKDTIVWKWTGNFDKDGNTLVSITNNGPAQLTHALLQYYFYDKDGKQLKEKQFEFYGLDIKKGETKELPRGPEKKELPPGTDAIDIVAQRADFMGNISMVDLSLAPDTKPKGQ